MGQYICADNDSGRIWALSSADGATLDSVQQIANMPPGSVYGGTSSCGLDANGEIYFVKIGGVGAGQIYKLKTIEDFVSDPASTLSQLGLFTNLTTLTPVPGFHPYNVNSPLWSDGAVKKALAGRAERRHTQRTGRADCVFADERMEIPCGNCFCETL